MITEFSDELQADAHSLFQEWRLKNPDGFFLTPKGKRNFVLHHVGCTHILPRSWPYPVNPEDMEDTIQCRHSLTKNRKICSSATDELLAWLTDESFSHGICRHCVDTSDPSHLKPSDSAKQRMVGWVVSLNERAEAHQDELGKTTILTTPDAVEDDTQHFYNDVSRSLQDSHSSRQARLATAPQIPDRISTTSTSFRRNPDVVAEVLLRAEGKCEGCLQPAPFARASDGTPYLEVHHHVMLAAGGKDTVANAIALCPNCHRAAHYA